MNTRVALFGLVALCSCAPSGGPDGGATVFSVVATTPASGATDVGLSAALIVQFSGPASSAQVSLSPAQGVVSQLDGTGMTLVAVPSGKWAPATAYTATVTAQNAAGASVTKDFTFTTAAGVVDTVGPTLVSSTPTQGELNVAGTRLLSLTFSEPIDPATFSVSATPATVLGPVSWLNGVTASFTMQPMAWAANTPYALAITADDLAGNRLTTSLSFTTTADVTAPTVVSTSPATGAMGITTSVVPTLTFSEPMDATVANAITFAPAVSCVFTLDATGRVLSCAHAAPLASNTLHTVTVATTARDRAGNALASPFSFTFTTSAMTDTMAPTVMTAAPMNMMSVRACSSLDVTFSEDMQRNAVESALAMSNHDGGYQFTWPTDGGSRVASVTLSPSLPSGMVTWTIGAGATDLAGNALSPTFSRTLQVLRETSFGKKTPSSDFTLKRQSDAGITETNISGLDVGDDNQGAESRSFFVFDLSGLPRPVQIRSAQLEFWVNNISNNVFGPGGTGPALVEVINPTGNHTTWWNAPAMTTTPLCGGCGCDAGMPGPTPLFTAQSGGPKSVDLIREVSAFVNASSGTTFPTLQLRLRPQNGTNGDSVQDYVSIAALEYAATCPAGPTACLPTLTIVYYEP